jgi:hypothetical protein
VSAPLLKTLTTQQTRGPSVDLEPTTDEDKVPDLLFTVRYPRGKFHRPDEKVPQQLYQRIISNLHQAYVLAILIWADLLLLFAEFPVHTVYYLARDSSRDVMIYFFQLGDAIWRGGRRGRGMSLYWVTSQLISSGKHVLEGIEWWYSAWRVRMDRMGSFLSQTMLIPLLGKRNETVTWAFDDGNSYWPFDSSKDAFEYLDAEFSSDTPRNPHHFPTKSELSAQSPLAKSLSKHIIHEYIAARLASIKKPSTSKPPQADHVIIRHELRKLNDRTSGRDIIDWVTEFYDMTVSLGYLESGQGIKIPLNLQIGQGMLGANLWKMVDCEDLFILGVALGTIEGSNYLVIAVPGGAMYLVMDPEGGCEEDIWENDIPYDVCTVFESVESIGTEVNWGWGIFGETYSIEDVDVDENDDVETEAEEDDAAKVQLVSDIDVPEADVT